MTRWLVWIIVGTAVAYDILCEAWGWQTISNYVRQADFDLAGLPRWILLALWLHWFVGGNWPRYVP